MQSNLSGPHFIKWLEQQGCSMIPITNDYEVVRFDCSQGIGVVYNGKRRGFTFSAAWVRECADCFMRGKPWDSGQRKTRRRTDGVSDKRKMRLMDRDGSDCFFCGKPFASHDLTKEHLLSLSQGGPDTLANMVLACEPCNTQADSMPLHKKINFRDNQRGHSNTCQSRTKPNHATTAS